MRVLAGIIIAAALAWSGWWWIGSTAVEKGLRGWFAAQAEDGWQAEYSDLSTHGFPNRFDTTITDLALADPETGLAVTAPFFQILALSYTPNHIIAIFPPDWTIASPMGRETVASDRMRGSVVFVPGTALALDRSSFVVDALTVGTGDTAATMAQARIATRRAPAENAHEIGIELIDFAPPGDMLGALDPTGTLPATVQTLRLDAVVAFDAPWDRFALQDARPQPTGVELDDLHARWGDLDFRAAGTLDIDAAGRPEGRITVKAENWRAMLGIATAAGLLPQGLAGTAETVLQGLAGMSGDPDTLDVPLTFAEGRISFGPIPLGPAPVLRLR